MMNMSLAPRFAAPYHMNSLPTALSTPWSSIPFNSSFAPPISVPTSTMGVPKNPSRRSSFSNMRYNSLKESRSYTRQRASPQSIDGFTTTSTRRPSRTKSISHLKSVSESSSSFLPRAHSWHSMGNVHSLNYSVAYANEMHLTPKSKRRRSMRRKRKPMVPPVSPLAATPPPPPPLSHQRRRGSFRKPRKPSIPLPERGVVRISTLDELPLPTTPRFKRQNSLNTDRLSTKGSVAASSIKRQTKCRNQSIQTQTMKSNDDNKKGSRINVDVDDDDDDMRSVSSVSSNTSASSVQRRINNSLRNDPCISAAIDEFRLHRRNSDHSTAASPHPRYRRQSRDSVHSDSTIRSPTPLISRSRSRSHSQSSFTSIERSEIRQIIKNIKCNETQSVESVSRSSSVPPAPPINNLSSVHKPKRSLVTEELDREFKKLRALIPDQELTYVTPSSFCKRKKSTKKSPPPLPPLPTFSELLRKVQLRPVDKSALTKPLTIEEPLKKLQIDSIPVVVVPQSSPIPPYESLPDEEDIKHDYAKPMKKHVEPGPPTVCRFQPLRNLSPKSSVTNYSRSLSALNWFQNNGHDNTLPTTFQPATTPTPTLPPPTDYATTSVNENIYASDIDVHLPMTNIEYQQIDDLQVHLENQTILTDYYYTDYDLKVKSAGSSSVLRDLTRVFKRKHEQKIRLTPPYAKHSRCSIM